MRSAVFVAAIQCLGCAAALVPTTSDPYKKLVDAEQLQQLGRSIPADELISEAVQAFKERGDKAGLADAYRAYGRFVVSSAVAGGPEAKFFRDNGFKDGSALENRFKTAVEYFRQSGALYEEQKQFDKATNVYFNMALAELSAGNKPSACAAWDKSIESNGRYLAENPGKTVQLPAGFSKYEDVIADRKAKAGC